MKKKTSIGLLGMSLALAGCDVLDPGLAPVVSTVTIVHADADPNADPPKVDKLQLHLDQERGTYVVPFVATESTHTVLLRKPSNSVALYRGDTLLDSKPTAPEIELSARGT